MTRTVSAILLTLSLSAGCSTVSQINLISTPQEVEMGRQFSREVEKKVKAYLNEKCPMKKTKK